MQPEIDAQTGCGQGVDHLPLEHPFEKHKGGEGFQPAVGGQAEEGWVDQEQVQIDIGETISLAAPQAASEPGGPDLGVGRQLDLQVGQEFMLHRHRNKALFHDCR